MQIFTLGYGERRIEAIISDLELHGITHVLDVRPTVDRVMNCSATSSAMLRVGIRYADLGRTFGYEEPIQIAQIESQRWSERHQANVQILMEIASDDMRTLCLLGGPTEPHRCHRCFLLGEDLQEHGMSVQHIENSFAMPHLIIMERALARV